MNKQIKWITQTAVMLALLIVLQIITKPFGQIVTGSCVNFVLASTALLIGLSSGVVISLASPFFAFLLGIGPAFLPIVPGISLGNAVLVVLLWFLLGKKGAKAAISAKIIAVPVAAAAKFLTLFLLITKLILPLLGLAEKQTAVISASFSWPQLITALIGSSLAIILWPRLSKLQKN